MTNLHLEFPFVFLEEVPEVGRVCDALFKVLGKEAENPSLLIVRGNVSFETAKFIYRVSQEKCASPVMF